MNLNGTYPKGMTRSNSNKSSKPAFKTTGSVDNQLGNIYFFHALIALENVRWGG